jgi:SAM-dependent methyltransferase
MTTVSDVAGIGVSFSTIGPPDGRTASTRGAVNLEELIRCPRCGAPVSVADDEAVCAAGHRFDVVDGVVLLVDEETLERDPQYAQQRLFFAAEFAQYRRYAPENWRISYLRRLRAAGALGDGRLPVIDVGVGGSGHTVIEAARDGWAVGCDLSPEALRAARGFADAEGVAGRTLWACCSAERLPFASESFSCALAIAVLEHVPDDKAALGELARVLRVGGRAWVTVPHALHHVSPVFRPPNRRHDRRLGHLRRYEAEALVDAGGRVGLAADEIQFTGHPVKVLQLIAGRRSHRVWWWCERRDLARKHVRSGSMQLSVVFTRVA